jgi:hypothetical protein
VNAFSFVDFMPEKVLRFLGAKVVSILKGLVSGHLSPIDTTGEHTVFLFMDTYVKPPESCEHVRFAVETWQGHTLTGNKGEGVV